MQMRYGRAAPGMAQASLSTGSRSHLLLPPATMDRMSECRGAQGCAGTTVPTSLQAKQTPHGGGVWNTV
jgi:hypothetical protein